MEELTKFVLMQGEELETRWISEHRPDARQHKCTTCNVVADGGRCMFNRAAHEAREIRLTIEQRNWWT